MARFLFLSACLFLLQYNFHLLSYAMCAFQIDLFLPGQKRKYGAAFSACSVNLPLPYLLLLHLIWHKVTHTSDTGIYIFTLLWAGSLFFT